jgi:hypothetical protein
MMKKMACTKMIDGCPANRFCPAKLRCIRCSVVKTQATAIPPRRTSWATNIRSVKSRRPPYAGDLFGLKRSNIPWDLVILVDEDCSLLGYGTISG